MALGLPTLVAWLVACLSALRSCSVYLDASNETNFQSQCREVTSRRETRGGIGEDGQRNERRVKREGDLLSKVESFCCLGLPLVVESCRVCKVFIMYSCTLAHMHTHANKFGKRERALWWVGGGGVKGERAKREIEMEAKAEIGVRCSLKSFRLLVAHNSISNNNK